MGCVVMAVFMAAALDSGVRATPAAGTTPMSESTQAAACDDWRPYRLGITPAESGTLVVACGSRYLSRISLYNASNTVLEVELPSWWSHRRVSDPLTITFGSEAALAAVTGGCYPNTNICDLPSGSTLYAEGSEKMWARFSVHYGNTVKANSARFIAQWIERRLTSPSRQFLSSVLACANDAKAVAERDESRTWDDALRIAITGYVSCSSLVREVTADDVRTRPQRVAVARRVVGLGKVFAGGSWIDELAYAAARIFRR